MALSARPALRRVVAAFLATLLALAGAASPVLADSPVADFDPAEFTPREVLARFGGPQPGRTIQTSFYSRALEREMPYFAVLPPGYQSSRERYPVVYLLHGMGGHPGELMGFGFLGEAQRQMAAGVLPPMILVFPLGEQAYWMNHANNGPRWGDYVGKDLVTEVDGKFRTLAARPSRLIAGVSMGGNGALQVAFNHPDTFGAIAAHSPVLRPRDRGFAFFGDDSYYRQVDPLQLAAAGRARGFTIWMDMGAGDQWAGRAQQLHEVLVRNGVEHSFSLGPGGHESSYWLGRVPEYLQFYGSVLAR